MVKEHVVAVTKKKSTSFHRSNKVHQKVMGHVSFARPFVIHDLCAYLSHTKKGCKINTNLSVGMSYFFGNWEFQF